MSAPTTPQDFDKLKLACIQQVRFYVDKGNAKLGLRLQYPKVTFDLRGTTAGKAFAATNELKFQPTLLFENADKFIEQTAGHEVGHLLARFKYRGQKIDPHGSEWQSVMWYLGLPATRCHNYDTSNVSTRIGKPRQMIISQNKTNSFRVSGGLATTAGGITVLDLD